MITSKQCTDKFGDPIKDQIKFERTWMVVYKLSEDLLKINENLPRKIYCNKIFQPILEQWLNALKNAELLNEIETFDGCFNVRLKRGQTTPSIHSYGCAVDFNAKDNPFNTSREQCTKLKLTPFTQKFVDLSRQYVDCGWDWKLADGQHYQIKSIKI